ncbi:hypothetical protein ACG74X_13255 [Marivita sp. S0852]|uniref:hypothetical protein n=1 Tax=Marivita sp. S0852 TaxID=3373893 RepID=UPI003982CF47
MTQSGPPEDTALEALFAKARDTPPRVPDALMARVMADAVAEAPKRARFRRWRQLLDGVGGWPAMAGLATAACFGIWTGGVLSDDLIWTFGYTEVASFDFGDDLGAFDMLLVDG